MTLELLQWTSPAVIIGVMLYLHRLTGATTGAATFLSPGEQSDPIPEGVPSPAPRVREETSSPLFSNTFLRDFFFYSVMECIEFTKPAHDDRDERLDRYHP